MMLQVLVVKDENNAIKVEFLIGLVAPQTLMPLKVRTGRGGAPFTVQTYLGWSVNVSEGYKRLQAITHCTE